MSNSLPGSLIRTLQKGGNVKNIGQNKDSLAKNTQSALSGIGEFQELKQSQNGSVVDLNQKPTM